MLSNYQKVVGHMLPGPTYGDTLYWYTHLGTNIQERLLNKPYVDEVALTGQKLPLKCC